MYVSTRTRFRLIGLLMCLWATCSISYAYAKPTWAFSVVIAVEKQTADYYQKAYGKSIDAIVKAQLATVTANFNSSPNFNGVYNFRVDSVYVFEGPAQNEVFRSHPRFQYCVVVDGKFTEPTVGGGWYGSYQTIYHSWGWKDWDGPFASTATDGLTHEFGHARGAIDIYGLRVEGAKNPVNAQTFEPVSSIMNYPYGNITWDEYTTNLLNSTADGPINGDQWIIRPFPNTIGVKVTNQQGTPLRNAAIEVYPVNWSSDSVSSVSILNATTNASGTYTFPSNPFQPATNGYPWTMRYCNFLIKVTYGSQVLYKWMPLYDVQNLYFKAGPNAVYTTEFIVTTDVDVATIRLGNVPETSFCSGEVITVPFTTYGTMHADNTFTLWLSDVTGDFTRGTRIAIQEGTSLTAISGAVSVSGPLVGSFRVKVVSSSPYAESDVLPITLKRVPNSPTVQPIMVCQNASAPTLQASGYNLLWYENSGGGTGSSVAPTISTTQAVQTNCFVSQTLDGCESPRSMLSVTIQALPAAPTVSRKDVCQFTTPPSLTATGVNLKWYDQSGSVLTTVPTVNTDKAGSFSVLVSQTLFGCEGPTATLPVNVLAAPTATLAGSQTILEGQSASLSVTLTADSPWAFSYRDSTATGVGAVQTVQAATSPYTISVKPLKTSVYRLVSVSNGCKGSVSSTAAVVTVMPLLAVDEASLDGFIDVFPVPATTAVTARIRYPVLKSKASVALTDMSGQSLMQQEFKNDTSTLQLSAFPTGTYILQIQLDGRAVSKRILKQ
ncbi:MULTISPECIES: T9SS type A sorting domain-containing protein [unclassified Spirosoma]|uniref:T9SS type A sorting domain-containing protein n=1 Tax=unclassified Spirosoma TaxID=2621999 RepID=UPI000AE2AC50|nr:MULTISPECIES: T9SS type A sorting domain-containing protein [unclassified Spirosoma]MBN8821975.1 T9SS type A sorting domain-containing protein [Spirosoma sp.]